MQKLERKYKSSKKKTDDFYAGYLSLRTANVETFLNAVRHYDEMNITSIEEDRLLREMGLSASERHIIEGLRRQRSPSGAATPDAMSEFTEDSRSRLALVRLAANPPPETGALQRLTASWLLRTCKSCRSS